MSNVFIILIVLVILLVVGVAVAVFGFVFLVTPGEVIFSAPAPVEQTVQVGVRHTPDVAEAETTTRTQ